MTGRICALQHPCRYALAEGSWAWHFSELFICTPIEEQDASNQLQSCSTAGHQGTFIYQATC